MSQSTQWAHLRPLHMRKCYTCGKTATEQLYTGLNDHVADYCRTHATAALKRFKEGNGL